MTVIIRKPKFDTIKTRSRTARTRSKGGGQWGTRVTHAHVRGRAHPNYISRSISNKPIIWGTRIKSEKKFKPHEYRPAENYLRKRARNIRLEDARAYQIPRAPIEINESDLIINYRHMDYDVFYQVVYDEEELLILKNKENKIEVYELIEEE